MILEPEYVHLEQHTHHTHISFIRGRKSFVVNDNAQVLIVDDSRSNRLKMQLALQVLGHKALTAENGSKALDMLSQHQFHLVLLDIEMPVLDGFGVLSSMLEHPEYRDIPIIVISASTHMDNIVRAIELGAQDFLPKNFNQVLFRARVDACIEKKKLADLRKEHLAQISREKQQVDSLLRSTLPTAAIKELKETNAVVPRRHENVVVLMADVVNFTQFCDTNPPEEAVNRLHNLVHGFEEIAITSGLEKIKTIGDAFMATAGLLHLIDNPVNAALDCALRMTNEAPQLANGWEIRVGLHVGPVVAGVIGRQKHLFDLWGDTVNTAARLTGLARPNGVCLSQEVSEKLGDIGQIMAHAEVKGKGKMRVYHFKMVS